MVGPGWQRLGPDPRIAAWAGAALPEAVRALAADGSGRRCGGTWAVGLDLLDNEADGAVAGVPFPWQALPLAPVALHAGQLSAVYPGYPQRDPGEGEAAQAWRLRRDAAHLDGLLAIGPARQRMMKEPHAWILGLPLTACSPDAAPLVVWEGSYLVMHAALAEALAPYPPDDWGAVDLTAVYTAARRRVFEECRRIELPATPGQATLLHRMTVHGVAPWRAGAQAPAEGRIIAYFRPLLPSVASWLRLE